MRRFRSLFAFLLLPLTLGVTVTSVGTVTTVVNPNLFTKPSGDEHLHGIVRDPITGDIYVGDWNEFTTGVSSFYGPFVENRDTIRRINALKEVSIVTYQISPHAMTYNPSDRRIYVAVGDASCSGNGRWRGPALNGVIGIDPATGKVQRLSGGAPGSANGTSVEARFKGPAGIAFDPSSGALFLSEGCQNRVRELDVSGNATTLAGSGQPGNADGVQLAATFNDPHGITFCQKNLTLYVADTGNNEIRAITFDGKVTTLAGSPEPGFVDATGSAARFNAPQGIACDDSGNLYVTDSRNNAVREVTASGVVTTLAGGKGPGNVDGTGSAARFSTPGDITYDPGDRALYVVDWGSNNIRKVVIATAQ